jgi:DNA-directed RNA polymerase subunit delta
VDYLYEKVSYLKGLAEGLNIDDSTKEGKLLLHMLSALEDFADAMDELYERQEDLEEYVSYMDEDLADVEEEVFSDYEDDDYYDYEMFDDDDTDFDYVEIECPNCHEEIYLDKELMDDECEIECPNCHESIIAEIDDNDEE